jgi:hypothetical protein
MLLLACFLLMLPASAQVADAGWREMVPEPVLEGKEEWLDLYWKAWEIHRTKIQEGTPQNGFVSRYVDEGFDPNISLWDTCFVLMFDRYGWQGFPTIISLDNFYRKQHPDGYICREIRESDGSDCWRKGDPDGVGAALLSWAEWEHYQVTGDLKRLRFAFPYLKRHYHWMVHNMRREQGGYFSSGPGSGMDNSPRDGAYQWVDMTCQIALNARCLQRIAAAIEKTDDEEYFRQNYEYLKALVDTLFWDDEAGYYFDLNKDGKPVRVYTLAGVWALAAEVAPPERAKRVAAVLEDRKRFLRAHSLPTLAADEPAYEEMGSGWRGAVWGPTNYVAVRGLEAYGLDHLAQLIAENHINGMARVFRKRGSVWENYAPDRWQPGDRARSEFVGSSGCGPIALLIETVLGVRVDAPAGEVRWDIRQTARHGVKRLRMGNNVIDLLCEERASYLAPARLTVSCTQPFRLVVTLGGREVRRDLRPGTTVVGVGR